MKKGFKRILAMLMSVTLILSGLYVGDTTVRAATSEMSVASVLNFSTDNGDWRFNLNMNGTWPTTGDFEEYQNTGLVAIIKNAAGEVLATVENDTLALYKNGPYWMPCIWGAYTGSHAPAEGDTVTFSSGQMTYKADASKVVHFAEELVLKYDGANWSVCEEQTVAEMSVESVLNFSTDNGDWRFNLNMNGTWPTTGDFEEYQNTGLVATIKNAAGEVLATVENDTLALYKNGPYWMPCIWGAYTGSHAPVEGDTVTFSSGQMTHKTDASKIVHFAEELVLKYDGTNWTCYEEVPVYEYVDVNLVWGDYPSNQPNKEKGFWDLYIETDATLPGVDWTTVFSDIQIVTGETVVPAAIKKVNNNLLNIFIMDDAALPVTAPVGTEITIKAGQSLGSDLGATGIRIVEDFTMVLGEDGRLKKYEESNPYDYVDMQLVWGDYPNNQPNKEKGYWDLYVETSVAVPGTAWSTAFADIHVMVGEQEVTASIKKADENLLNIFIMDETVLPVTAPVGTEITVKAGQSLGSDLETQGINVTNDFTMVLSRDGKLVEKGKEITYTDITPIQFLEEIYSYDTALSRWNIYIQVKGTMPGNPWQGYFHSMEYTINGKSYVAEGIYNAGEYGLFFYIPESVLASDFTGNKTIVLKSGYGLSTTAGENGIYLTKDITIYANEYGWSVDGFVEPLKVSQTNALLTLDKDTVFGGNEHGIYVNTNDTFSVDTTWQTKIRALASDENSGVFYNGKRVNAPIIRYADGKAYVGLADIGITARDKDKVTVKGVFESDGYGVSYKEVSFYYNGKIWGTEYEKAKKESYTKLTAESVHPVSTWVEDMQRWNVYLKVDNLIPGEIDKMQFQSLTLEVDGKTIQTAVYHSYQDTLFFPIEKQYLAKDCADGIKITLKAGKALAGDKTTGIHFVKDFTFYTYKGTFSNTQPTNNTEWQSITVVGMNTTAAYRKDSRSWIVHLKLREDLTTETGTNYLELPISISGKTYNIQASKDGAFLMLTIPESVLPEDTKSASITIAAGAKAYANGGKNGIEFKEDFTMYVFNGVISEQEFTEIQEYEGRILGVQNALEEEERFHIYLRLNKEFPGTEWYEIYDDFVYYYNGKAIHSATRKSASSNNKFMYFSVEKSVIGMPKEGDVIKIVAGTVMTCGGYQMTITNDFQLMYEDGLWSQYVQTDVQPPKDDKSLWEIARFDSGYIPTTEDGSVMYSNEDVYNKISSIEPMKDFTVSFNAKKFFDDETTPTFGVILRGNAISEDEEMTHNLLNGYVITFSVLEEIDENEESVWTGYINLWKNGENYSLLDQYRISYVHDKSDHPYFQTDVDYNYEFSIYNITETCVCITVRVNGKLAMRYYDEAGSDPFDPAVNAGTFQVFAGCPNYITDDIAELSTVIAEKDTCQVGDKVRVAATYPSVLEGAEFEIAEEGATISNGVFVADKTGTYTVTATYNGKTLAAKTITVTEAEETGEDANAKLPIALIVIGVIVVVAGITGVTVFAVSKRRKKHD